MFVRFRNMSPGKTTLKLRGAEIQIFNRERTIVDSFRHLSVETAIKSLKEGLKGRGNRKVSIRKLQQYAKKRHVNLTPYILTLTT